MAYSQPCTIQAKNLVNIGWFVYGTWKMEAEALAAVISKHIQIEIGLHWKTISLGKRDKIPVEQQVRALHIEVAVQNRLAAQKALLAVYGRKSSGTYPNGIRLRFALPIGAAYNLNTRAKLEKLRSRQQLWSQTYKKGQTWKITQLDFYLSDTSNTKASTNPNSMYHRQKVSSLSFSRPVHGKQFRHHLPILTRTFSLICTSTMANKQKNVLHHL